MKNSIYSGLNYSTRYINLNWKIKVSGMFEENRIHQLVGVSGLLRLIGTDMTNKIVSRADKDPHDSFTIRLRRGIKIVFYVQ